MLRRLLALGLAAAVHTASLSAPFVHAHLDDHATDHHAPRGVHAHLSGHGQHHHHETNGGPELEQDGNEQAVFIQMFSALAPTTLSASLAAPAAFMLAAPSESAAHRPLDVSHGHDPPSLRLLPSRAPPALVLS